MTVSKSGIQKDYTSMVGMTVDEGIELLATQGLHLRVIKEDGEPFMVTMDFRLDRVNVIVDDGIITSIQKIG